MPEGSTQAPASGLFPGRAVGNRALGHLIQTRLTVYRPGDRYELEADRVADAVLRVPSAAAPAISPLASTIQRKCAACASGLGTCPECEDDEPVQRQAISPAGTAPTQDLLAEDEDEDVLRRQETAGTASTVPPGADARIRSLQGGGQPLPRSERAFFEPRIGHDLGQVRVHSGPRAADAARAVDARAFTLGRDVVFGSGQYAPGTRAGRHLLAHELTHVVQQRAAPPIPQSGEPLPIARSAPPLLFRKKLPVAEIKRDVDEGKTVHPDLFSWLHIMGDRTGEVGLGADRPKGTGPDPAPVPTDKSLPIQGFFFPSFIRHHDQRALVIGGIHGNERPSFEIGDALVKELQSSGGLAGRELFFHTLVVPRLNPGGIADDDRCNRQKVDLNRNFLTPKKKPGNKGGCANTLKAPIQPETQVVIDLLNVFQPHRILSLHAISNPNEAGITADPAKNAEARTMACSMAGLVVDASNRRGNRLTSKRCDPVFPGSTTGPTSLGAFGPTHSIPGQTVPVITLEVPEKGPLAATGTRTVGAFLPPVRGFLGAPAKLLDFKDQLLLNELAALTSSKLKLFLTGLDQKALAIKIQNRVKEKVGDLNALIAEENKQRRKKKQQPLPTLNAFSRFRAFGEPKRGSKPTTGTAAGQGGIVFDKFFLTLSRSNGWDSLPQSYWLDKTSPTTACTVTDPKQRAKKCVPDRTKWLSETSKKRLEIILEFSAVPGASRHHWGTEVDLNSDLPEDWQPGAKLYELGQWLQKNAHKAGFAQVYVSGRTGGHHEEPWHWSYTPLSIPLLKMYNKDVKTDQDVVPAIIDFFQKRAAAAKVQIPGDFGPAIKALDIMKYVTSIAPGL